jgi:NhaP-type Na+/H+ or K+/H+ antiporter
MLLLATPVTDSTFKQQVLGSQIPVLVLFGLIGAIHAAW